MTEHDNYVDNGKAFKEKLADLSSQEKVESCTYEETLHIIKLPRDAESRGYGSARITEDNDEVSLFHFEITLGPANSSRLVDFLQTLPAEPDEG